MRTPLSRIVAAVTVLACAAGTARTAAAQITIPNIQGPINKAKAAAEILRAQFREAGQWAVSQLKEFGLSNVKLEKWGPFGPGWSYSNFSASMVEPKMQNLLAFPVAWTHGTEGPRVAEATLAVIRTEADFCRDDDGLGQLVLR